MLPIRELPTEKLLELKDTGEIRALNLKDFANVLREN
jgi:hypothetical protein